MRTNLARFLVVLLVTTTHAQWDSLEIIPKDAPLSFKQVHTPPDFGVCKGADDYLTCVRRYLLRKVSENGSLLRREASLSDTIFSQYYFEVSPEGKVENIRVQTTHSLNEFIIAHGLTDNFRVVAPALDSLGNPVRSYWYDQISQILPGPEDIKRRSSYADDDLQVKQLSEYTFQHISYLETEQWGKVACNGMIIIYGDEALIMDTPVNETASEKLLNYLIKSLKVKVVGVVATHFHVDCLGGLDVFHKLGIPSYGIGRTLALAEAAGYTRPKAAISGKRTIEVSGTPVQFAFFGAGHTQDNIVGYFPKEKVLFGGCLVKADGAGKGNLADADTAAWPGTIRAIMEAYPEVEVVLPGHGEAGGPELLEYTARLFE